MDEEAQVTPPEAALEAAPEATPEEAVVILTRWASVFGDPRAPGKVLRLPAEEAERLVSAGDARVANDFEKKIGGVA